MEWNDEAVTSVRLSLARLGGASNGLDDREMRIVMTRAVELVAARGGTMTADQIAELGRSGLDEDERVMRHIAAQGANLAAVEVARKNAYDDGIEAMRAACLSEVYLKCTAMGMLDVYESFKAAIEGAAP